MTRTVVRSLNKRQALYTSIFIILLSIFFTGCGLEEYAYLYPPDAWNESGTDFYFRNNTKNDSSVFMGFKLLYKFYDSSDDITTAISSVESLYENYPTSIYSKMKSSLGYNDLIIGTSSSLTIGQTNRTDDFTIRLNFTNVISSSDDDVPITVYNGTISTTPTLTNYIYRSVKINGSYAGFSTDELDGTTTDLVAGTNYDSDSGDTYLMLYVLAYGYDTSTWTAIYSEPQYFSGTVDYVNGLTVND